jgi:hypothetical protein
MQTLHETGSCRVCMALFFYLAFMYNSDYE